MKNVGIFLPALAAPQWSGQISGVPTLKSLETLLGNAITGVGSILIFTLFIMVIVAGYKFLFSGGDQKKIQEAQGTLTNAIAGIVIVSLAVLILRTIAVLTGVSGVLQATIP